MQNQRYLLLARRLGWGIRFGFAFRGTTRTPYPARLCLGGKWVRIARHGHQLEFYDLIDVLLDDAYGLRRIKHARTIVDIGANIGLFSGLSRHQFPKATIHAYEPDAITFRMAEQNLAGLATVYNEGVWSADGAARIKRRGASSLTNQVAPEEGGCASGFIPDGTRSRGWNDRPSQGGLRRRRMDLHEGPRPVPSRPRDPDGVPHRLHCPDRPGRPRSGYSLALRNNQI
jgi:hypothetical protein